jgi:hypothetical protein
MRWILRYLYVVTEYKPMIEVVYATLAAWSLVRLILAKRSTVFTLRDWFGALGLVAGICSGAFFAWFYIYFWVAHSLIAHGFALFTYYIAGSCLAVAGMILALIGRGWVRRSASTVSLVMAFQWLGMWDMSPGLDQDITIATLVLLLAWGVMSLVVRHFAKRQSTPPVAHFLA